MPATLAAVAVRPDAALTNYGIRQRPAIAIHLQAIGILIAAGDDGIPLAMLGRMLYPRRGAGEPTYQRARRLVDVLAGALPIWQTATSDGGPVTVGMDGAAFARRMRAYGIPVDVLAAE